MIYRSVGTMNQYLKKIIQKLHTSFTHFKHMVSYYVYQMKVTHDFFFIIPNIDTLYYLIFHDYYTLQTNVQCNHHFSLSTDLYLICLGVLKFVGYE
jgi:hypothetical protein